MVTTGDFISVESESPWIKIEACSFHDNAFIVQMAMLSCSNKQLSATKHGYLTGKICKQEKNVNFKLIFNFIIHIATWKVMKYMAQIVPEIPIKVQNFFSKRFEAFKAKSIVVIDLIPETISCNDVVMFIQISQTS